MGSQRAFRGAGSAPITGRVSTHEQTSQSRGEEGGRHMGAARGGVSFQGFTARVSAWLTLSSLSLWGLEAVLPPSLQLGVCGC